MISEEGFVRTRKDRFTLKSDFGMWFIDIYDTSIHREDKGIQAALLFHIESIERLIAEINGKKYSRTTSTDVITLMELTRSSDAYQVTFNCIPEDIADDIFYHYKRYFKPFISDKDFEKHYCEKELSKKIDSRYNYDAVRTVAVLIKNGLYDKAVETAENARENCFYFYKASSKEKCLENIRRITERMKNDLAEK